MITRRDILKSGRCADMRWKMKERTRPNDSPKVETIDVNTYIYTIRKPIPSNSAIDMIIRYDIGRITIVNEQRQSIRNS